MNYSDMTTEKLETLKATVEEKLDSYIGMSFASTRSEFVTYEIDSVYYDEVLIAANHDSNGLIRGYTVTIDDGDVDDDVEYNRYNTDEEIVDGGYMSFDRLPKDVRNAILEISSLYKDLETINNILDARTEEEPEEVTEEEEETKEEPEDVSITDVLGFSGFDYDDVKAKLENDPELGDLLGQFEEPKEEPKEEPEEMLLTIKRVIPQLYEVSYRGQHITDLFKTDLNDWIFAGLFFAKVQNKALYLLLTTVFDMRFKTKKQAIIELEGTFARFEVAKAELGI